jgi:glyoxylase-like metal-dependent hydrolase (beta-lactamase superfamily II)
LEHTEPLDTFATHYESEGTNAMSGAWTTTQTACVPIHTFTAPEEGWLVNSHIIEFASQLFVIDAQYTLPFAQEVARYASRLRKRLTRLYVTHYHPDHLLGAEAFDAPLFALESVADKITTTGDRVAREEHDKVGNDIPATSRQPDRRIAEGDEVVDGVLIEYRRLCGAETEDALVVGLPGAGAIVVQDLVYDHAHLFLGERHFDGWRTALREYRSLPYGIVLPGHGAPGDKRLYDAMIVYLDFAEKALAQSTTPTEFRTKILGRFPDYGCRKILDHELRFLFR